MARGILQHSLRQRTSSRNDIISGDDSGGGTILPLTMGGLPKQKQHQHMHRVGRIRRRKTTRSSWEHRFKLRVIVVNIVICIIFISVGYMFHRVVINHTHRHTLKSTEQQQHVRGRQKEHTSLFSQHHSTNGSSQNQHVKKERRQHNITYDFTCRSHPNKKGILNDMIIVTVL